MATIAAALEAAERRTIGRLNAMMLAYAAPSWSASRRRRQRSHTAGSIAAQTKLSTWHSGAPVAQTHSNPAAQSMPSGQG